MVPTAKSGFELDGRIERDTRSLVWLGLCELRLHRDARWPWTILVPQRAGVQEIHELTPLDQAMLTFEINMVSRSLKKVTDCEKINIAALGNVVPQLHVHIVARRQGDTNWPDPVWGVDGLRNYSDADYRHLADRLRSDLLAEAP